MDEKYRRIDHTKKSKKILGIVVKREIDTDADLSYLGVYTDTMKPWNIDRRTGKYIAELEDEELPDRSGREYRFFGPYAGGEEPGTEDYKKYGLQDFERMEAYHNGQWWMLGITAEAKIVINGVIQKIWSGGLWGIESDSDQSYFQEVADEQLSELKDILIKLGFTNEEINKVKVKCQ